MSLRRLTALLFLALAPMVAVATNNYPIVLVNGLLGWGRDELVGLPYWGGIQGDLQEQLKKQGYTVYTAAVGPFSSNWDRACELYAIIKGGTVDYGLNHSSTHGHDRYGRTYKGLYPEWGNTNTKGQINKIHLIGHSMGGTTIRMLAQLLSEGTTGAPIAEDPASSSLFAGGKNWVHSITTISTPNQGTTLVDGLAQVGSSVTGLLPDTLALIGFNLSDPSLNYDVKMDQWGFAPKGENELLTDYVNRAFTSRAFLTADSCMVSLSTPGAAAENVWVRTLPNIYYFSYATQDTHATKDDAGLTIHVPNNLTMISTLQVAATFIGSRFPISEGLTEDWQPNDGSVPVISQLKDSTGTLVKWRGFSGKGKWNSLGTLNRLDHLAVIGITLHTQIRGLYMAHALLLKTLAADTTTATRLRQLESEGSTSGSLTADEEAAALALEEAMNALSAATAAVQTSEDVQALCNSPINDYAASLCASVLNNTTPSTSGSADTGARRLRA